MRSLIFFVLIFLNAAFSFAADAGEVSLFSKQIAWTAANLENPQVVAQFRNSLQKNLADKTQWQSPEGQKVLQQGKNLFGVIKLKESLQQCKLEQAGALGIRDAIEKALGNQATRTDICVELVAEVPKVLRFKNELDTHFQNQARDQIVAAAQNNLQKTKSYWTDIEKENPVNLAVSLTEKEQELKEHTPQAGAELLLYTDAIKDRKNKNYVSKADVQKAFKEVKTELAANTEYLQEMSRENSETALRRLITTNPGAVAQYLMEHPESLDLICKSLQSVNAAMARNEKLDKVFFWGGLVIAGVMIASGVGALAGGALAGTLTTIAAGAALAGTAVGADDFIYSSTKTHEAFIEAQNIRSSSYGEGLSADAQVRMQNAKSKAYSELQGVGYSAVSLIPFGAGFKVMKSAAQASRLGSFAKVAKEGAKVETESVQSLTSVLKEISADKDVYQILEKTKARVSDEEMGQFLGYLSDLSEAEKKKVFEFIKAKPDKVAEAIQDSSKAGVCK